MLCGEGFKPITARLISLYRAVQRMPDAADSSLFGSSTLGVSRDNSCLYLGKNGDRLARYGEMRDHVCEMPMRSPSAGREIH